MKNSAALQPETGLQEAGMPLHFTISIGVTTLAEKDVNLDARCGRIAQGVAAEDHGGGQQHTKDTAQKSPS